MKTVDLSDETYAALHRLAGSKGLTIDELLAALLKEGHAVDRDSLPLFLASAEFKALGDPADRYLALLAWCATTHATDFGDFVSHQESGHRYLMLGREGVQEVRAHNHARQIGSTQFWAVMTIDQKSKRRFVRRLLEFIGCRDEAVHEACTLLGLGPADSDHPRLLGVA